MIENEKVFIPVDEWEPTDADTIVGFDGKLVIIPFDKIFNKENVTSLNTFVIKKESYVKQLGHSTNKDGSISKGICHYINYFIKYYDPNNELLLSYVKLKYVIDNKRKTLKLIPFIKMLYSILFTDTLKEKIIQLVEDNYHIDVTSPRNGKKYAQSMEFTNEHAKLMMMISMSMKILVPVMFHFINSTGMIKEPGYIYQFYERLFYIYNDTIDIYNKLWLSTLAKVNHNFSKNRPLWEQREIFGTDPLIYLDALLKEKIISEIMFKYSFDKNIISYNSVVLDNQLGFFIKETYDYTLRELSNVKDADGLSGLDKLEINSTKIDESLIILSGINIKKTIKRIKKKMQITITEEEIEFYRKNHHINKFHIQLIFYFFARYFGNYRDLNLLTRRQYLTLLIILKRRLQVQGNTYLPQILTGNIEGKINTRTIQNTKFLMKIENSSIYQSLIEDKFSLLEELKKSNLILNLLSTILNTTFTLVDYDNKDRLGEKIEVGADIVSDEFLNFLNQL